MEARLDRRRDLFRDQERRAARAEHDPVRRSDQGHRDLERRQLHQVVGEEELSVVANHFDNGSGRTWNLTSLLVVPLPPSMWNGARVEMLVQIPLPFQPAFASSMRP